MPRKNAPTSPAGYAVTSLRSSFGKQVSSNVASSPGASFGSARRGDFERTYAGLDVDRARLRSTGGRGNNLGPSYRTYSTFGKMTDSRKLSGTNTKFGTGTREVQSARTARGSPGPGAYRKMEQSVGTQVTSKYKSGSRACFGTATRDTESKVFLSEEHAVKAGSAYGNRDRSPGPGHYSQRSCIGKHPLYKSLPAWGAGTEQRFKSGVRSIIDETPAPWHYRIGDSSGRQSGRGGKGAGFGTSTRDGRTAVYISSEHEKTEGAPWGPGPTTGLQKSSFHTQNMSKNKTNPAYRFGTSKRGVRGGDNTPGPGAYYA